MRIAVIGAGSAGLFSAWYLAQMRPDAEVHVYDRGEPGHGAMHAAAGMLAPVNELEFQELELLRAGLRSLALYHEDVVPGLGDIGLRNPGTLEVGLQADDVGYLKRLYEFQKAQGLDVEWVSGGAVQELEPFVSTQIRNAIHSRYDVQVDNRLLARRLVEGLVGRGGKIFAGVEVRGWKAEGDGVVVVTGSGTAFYDGVVVAVGVPSSEQAGLLPYKLYPVRGEMVALQPFDKVPLQMTVRIRSTVWGPAYVVPKPDRILCGSTSEEKGYRAVNTAGGLLDILRKCYAAVPGIYEMEVQEVWNGLRPATLDRLPVLDKEAGGKVVHLNGLYRHGILLGPLMGRAAARLLLEGGHEEGLEGFGFR